MHVYDTVIELYHQRRNPEGTLEGTTVYDFFNILSNPMADDWHTKKDQFTCCCYLKDVIFPSSHLEQIIVFNWVM